MTATYMLELTEAELVAIYRMATMRSLSAADEKAVFEVARKLERLKEGR